MIGKVLARLMPQSSEVEKTWDMSREVLSRKFRLARRFTTKLNTKSELDKDTISKRAINAIRWYIDGSKTAKRTGI